MIKEWIEIAPSKLKEKIGWMGVEQRKMGRGRMK